MRIRIGAHAYINTTLEELEHRRTPNSITHIGLRIVDNTGMSMSKDVHISRSHVDTVTKHGFLAQKTMIKQAMYRSGSVIEGGIIYIIHALANVNIHVIDTLSAGGENDLIIKKLNLLIGQGLSYEEVIKEITAYQAKTKLLFVLSKVDNLVKNGRLSKLLGAVVGLLNIRMVGEASQDGKLELLQKARGAKKSLIAAFDELIKAGYAGGQIIIAHRNNPKFCQQFSEMVRERFPQAVIEVIPTSGLCSFYAEENGLLMGYEIQ